jgi:hypothetical protein
MNTPLWIETDRARQGYEFRLAVLSALAPKWSVATSVPASWAKPVATWLIAMDHAANTLPTDAEFTSFMESHLAALPGLVNKMDHAALAAVLEQGMAAAIIANAGSALAKIHDLQPMAVSFDYGPLQDAVAKMDRKSPVAAILTSAQWDKVPVAIRERSQFSARVGSVRLLQHIQDQARSALAWETEKIAASDRAAGGEAFIDRSSFIASARKIAIEEGINTTTPNQYGTVRDIRSAKRLGLIWDMQTGMASEYARWKINNDADVLDAFPAQRLVRIEERDHPRPPWFWPSRWAEAYAKSGSVQSALEGEMVALKTSGIWAALSRFGTPWPPFDYGSGMGLEDVSRDEAEALGLLRPSEVVPPEPDPGFNTGFEMGVRDLDPKLVDWITTSMGDVVSLVDGVLKWISK